MSLAALRHELEAAMAADRPVLAIRMTTDTPPGLVAALPITPERARIYGLRELQDRNGTSAGVVAEPEVWARGLEILLHPLDFDELITDIEPIAGQAIELEQPTGRFTIYGIPVAESGVLR